MITQNRSSFLSHKIKMDEKLEEIAKRHNLSEEALLELDSYVLDIVSRGATLPPSSLLPDRELSKFVTKEAATQDFSDVIASEGLEHPMQGRPEAGQGIGSKYEDLGVLGTGGMGIVRRVRDLELRRSMAMKIARPSVMDSSSTFRRFVREARTTAQLQHPGILPVHEFGRLKDGRVFFTMQEVRGQTLGDVIRQHHRKRSRFDPSSLRRIIEMFRKACEAVSYAHSRGVIHRDLKPANIMVGEHGEVLVLDWGLAKLIGEKEESLGHKEERSLSAFVTREGSIAGTPAFMSPEQASGKVDQINSRSDVYALGAILYNILAGHSPYRGKDSAEVIQMVIHGSLKSVIDALGQDVRDNASSLEALVRICEVAMSRDPRERFPDANSVVVEVTAWLDGSLRRAQALSIVSEAKEFIPEAALMLEHAALLNLEAQSELETIYPWAEDDKKAAAWEKEDRAALLKNQAAIKLINSEQLLHAALSHAPDLPEINAALAVRYKDLHRIAEQAKDSDSMARAEAMLQSHAEALPEQHPERQHHFAYLQGDGVLSIHTDPPGAEVLLHQYELSNRRMRPNFICFLGKTPIEKYPLPMGSYLLLLRHEGYEEVRYPVFIGRQECCDGIPPGSSSPTPIPLPPKGVLQEHDCYVPPGWFLSGGDPKAMNSLQRRKVWVEGFVIRRFPVTNGRYLAFLNQLVMDGREDEALLWAPREAGGPTGELGAMIYGRSKKGWFYLQPDTDGDLWDESWPVLKVNWLAANSFAAEMSVRTGLSWRLPNELEWEKASRGVDGRHFPWGDFMDPSWVCMRQSHFGRFLPGSVFHSAVDVSPFGVYGMGGNARDWTSNIFHPKGPGVEAGRVLPEAEGDNDNFYTVRGGSWFDQERFVRVCSRSSEVRTRGNAQLSFRILRGINW
jgi:eukaryotic-like serine/threonine-protein kinase